MTEDPRLDETRAWHSAHVRGKGEAGWVVAFVGLAMMSLSLMRSWPVAKVPGSGRTIFSGYSMASRLYPQVLANDALWKDAGTLESVLASGPDFVKLGTTWIGSGAVSAQELRALGVTALDIFADKTRETPRDEQIVTQVRVCNDALGQPAFGMALMDRYRREFVELASDFRPVEVATGYPRLMGLGAPSNDWSRIYYGRGNDSRDPTLGLIGARDAVAGSRALGRQQDAERVLLIEPDVIILSGDAREFARDPRWRGLKAVRNHRVYSRNPRFCGYSHDLDDLPFATRWQAEILHPEQLAPRVRELLRAHYLESYGYAMSDDMIDELLCVAQNGESVGYARFTRSSTGVTGKGTR